MLKRTYLTELKAGMVLGRPIYNEDLTVLFEQGTVLTEEQIVQISCMDLPAVTILLPDPIQSEQLSPPKPVLQKSTLIEVGFLKNYQDSFFLLRDLYEHARENRKIDVSIAEQVVASISPLIKTAAKAIAQIHSMSMDGDYRLHHTLHVAILAGLMGKWLRMKKPRRRRLLLAAIFMDIGNQRLSPALFAKKGVMSNEERNLMRRHVQFGYEMVMASPFGQEPEIADAVLQSHERNDRSGYPKGLKGEQICDFAKILAILDIYDAMGSNHSHIKKHSPYEIFNMLYMNIQGGQIDMNFGVPFIRHVSQSLHETWVMLSSGEKAKIVYIDETRVLSLPVVQTAGGEFLDLNRQSNIKVEHLLTNKDLDQDDDGEESVGFGL
ncbi:hypothetical protein TAMA11512_11730 [Selenomonas sp. TAMA-11512]|uniref:HD-GYP domain-containing protein n=1 Tax=Selenomonas sp. TAMA-11512 TaxID=3095337 RepID=UPI00308FF4F8|nr:hypothetical protein TAMA11512_11730 [Selenomonas sp. TAMA-11512]